MYIDRLLSRKGKNRPAWLDEHLEYGPVDPSQIEGVLKTTKGISFSYTKNQSLKLSYGLSRLETTRFVKSMMSALSHATPSLTGFVVSRFLDNSPPYARRIYTIRIDSESESELAAT